MEFCEFFQQFLDHFPALNVPSCSCFYVTPVFFSTAYPQYNWGSIFIFATGVIWSLYFKSNFIFLLNAIKWVGTHTYSHLDSLWPWLYCYWPIIKVYVVPLLAEVVENTPPTQKEGWHNARVLHGRSEDSYNNDGCSSLPHFIAPTHKERWLGYGLLWWVPDLATLFPPSRGVPGIP